MSWIDRAAALLFPLLVSCGTAQSDAAQVCPVREAKPLRFVDVFDGPPAEAATLMPDVAQPQQGEWKLGYVYDAGRFVSIRCKYTDGQTAEVKLSQRVEWCRYAIDSSKTLKLNCQ